MTRLRFDETRASARALQTRLRLRELAQQQDLTIAELQRRTGLSRATIASYWNNTIQAIHLVALGLLAEALGVSPCDLITNEPEEPSETKADSPSL